VEERQALIVEDDPDIRKLLRKYLERLSLQVQEAGTGKAALSVLQEQTPALVCLDLMLPESSGYDICEAIRRSPRLKDVPVLVVSARSMPPDRALAEEVGATAYLIKPIRWASFSATVRRLLEDRSATPS
jgi:two-component system chemotaxis response regulator CheY